MFEICSSYPSFQNLKPEAERLFYGYYLICNATNQALRFGQVHTDESVVLKSSEMHEYSWRTHKKEKQVRVNFDGF